jgi:Fic family protein
MKSLVGGLIAADHRLESASFDAVIAAAMVAFGFVFIHPFQDGNGRIHRYIIHHTLARKHFAQQGVIFPVSASILNHIEDYRAVLQIYSQPLLDHIEWRTTPDNNIEVTNDTADYYRYFDATPQAEFLYDCVHDTIQNIIPQEVRYLEQYDRFKRTLDTQLEMPDKTVALLLRFLQQNHGKLSKRARQNEFRQLKAREVEQIESWFQDIFDEA